MVQFESKWLKCRSTPDVTVNPSARIFCFPWAGGNASPYVSWGNDDTLKATGIEVWTVEYPARLTRIREEMCETMEELVDSIVQSIHALLDASSYTPIMFYGHSMGGTVSYEVALQLRQVPHVLFLAAAASPIISPEHIQGYVPWKNMSHDDAIDRLRRLGGTPEEVLSNTELMEVMLPAIRADFDLLNYYRLAMSQKENIRQVKSPCKGVLLCGTNDKVVPMEKIKGWHGLFNPKLSDSEAESVKQPLDTHIIEGSHFFITKVPARMTVMKILVEYL
ncbi:hypothetical protein SARC_12774 [Sphaeroforma arctica JP610]|uniref:Thioesterase domain-containing protein n=1 Tax=Sphaeroforma arctica JP610 TaxID=667725 RepID=A0A0L0FD40_9EUKA|nr:hypothetical protein SARC_12774 [Sphaeroforma arctica JP610]KNC74684.1 hypothetical protein SARC_12774 [Sphaeroforma arctica JP610]|eukprot:XP_014148586.1 hypothetical protein SARC_12774 [Sphaeroforma arctica JP610]